MGRRQYRLWRDHRVLQVNRKRAQEFSDQERRRGVPLREVVNFGPVTAAELEEVGIRTLSQLEALGFEEVARRWVDRFPERLCVTAFMGIVATLDGVAWTEVTSSQKAQARALVNQMRSELNLPPVRPPTKQKLSRRRKN